MAFPAPPDTYPGEDAVAAFLRDYAIASDLPVRLGMRVTGLERIDGEFHVHAGEEVFRAGDGRQAIAEVARTGPTCVRPSRVPGGQRHLR
jgi:putative flavoprotein involved in K+ transport